MQGEKAVFLHFFFACTVAQLRAGRGEKGAPMGKTLALLTGLVLLLGVAFAVVLARPLRGRPVRPR